MNCIRFDDRQTVMHFCLHRDLDHTPDPGNELLGEMIASQGAVAEANDKTQHRKTFKRRRKPRHRDGTVSVLYSCLIYDATTFCITGVFSCCFRF